MYTVYISLHTHIFNMLAYTTLTCIESCVRSIKNSLDDLPGLPRTQIGFITFDSSVHFYNLKSSLTAPQMLVVSDLQDIGKCYGLICSICM